MSAVSMEQTNALKHAELFKSKPYWEDTESRAAVTFREKVSCGSGNAQSSRLNRELRGARVQRMSQIFALRSSEVTSFITWFILGSITRDA